MPNSVSSIPNLGPATDAAFAKAGITTAEALRTLGADAAYSALLAAGTKPHFIAFYSLVLGLQGRPWNDCQGTEKDMLRARFDAIKAGANTSTDTGTALGAALAEIGVLARPR